MQIPPKHAHTFPPQSKTYLQVTTGDGGGATFTISYPDAPSIHPATHSISLDGDQNYPIHTNQYIQVSNSISSKGTITCTFINL